MPLLADTPLDYALSSPYDYTGDRTWTCGDTTFELMIVNDTVKVGPKVFTRHEANLLKGRNGLSKESTFDILIGIDERVRRCEFEFGTFEIDDPWNMKGFTYTGMHIGGVPDGVGYYEDELRIKWATIVDKKYHGWLMYLDK